MLQESCVRIEELNKKNLCSQDGHFFDNKDRRIGNVKDPIEGKNVNKRFMQKNML